MPQRGTIGKITHDDEDSQTSTSEGFGSLYDYGQEFELVAQSETVFFEKTLTLSMTSVIHASVGGAFYAPMINVIMVRLYIDGVFQAATGWIQDAFKPFSAIANKACGAGSRTIQAKGLNNHTSAIDLKTIAVLAGGCSKI